MTIPLRSATTTEGRRMAGAFTPVGRDRQVGTALRAYALFAASAHRGAVRILP